MANSLSESLQPGGLNQNQVHCGCIAQQIESPKNQTASEIADRPIPLYKERNSTARIFKGFAENRITWLFLNLSVPKKQPKLMAKNFNGKGSQGFTTISLTRFARTLLKQ